MIIENDTLNCLTNKQTISILEEFEYCQLKSDSIQHLSNKIVIKDSIISFQDSTIISQEKEVSILEKKNHQKDIQNESLESLNEIFQDNLTSQKKRKWLFGGGGILLGLAAGALLR